MQPRAEACASSTACEKRSRMLRSLSPDVPPISSGPATLINGTPSSPAIACASSVLPHPGGARVCGVGVDDAMTMKKITAVNGNTCLAARAAGFPAGA